MSEMVDRVVQAIAAKLNRDATLGDIARAAIEAMREPTPEMTQADNVHWDYSCHVCGGAKEHWERMIEAALK